MQQPLKLSFKMSTENNQTPLVSVIMPVYNGSKWLGISIPSVLEQTVRDFELIVLNDGSTDSSLQVLEEFASQDHRLRVINQENRGPGKTLNKGISLARGKYLCFLDQDDSFIPTYLERLVNKMETADSDAVLCYFKGIEIPGDRCRFVSRYYPDEDMISIESFETKQPFIFNFVAQTQKILRRDFVLRHHILFSESKNLNHDYLFHFLVIYYANKLSIVPRELFIHRYHGGQITAHMNDIKCYIDTFRDIEVWKQQYIPKDKQFMHCAIFLLDFVAKLNGLTKQDRKWVLAKIWRYEWRKKLGYLLHHVKDKKNKKIYYFFIFHYSVEKAYTEERVERIPIPRVGRHSYCSPGLYVANLEGTSIGNFVSIGMNCHIGHGEHPLHFLSTSPYFYYDELGFKMKETPSHPEYWDYEPVCIGHDVWIGDNVFIKNGVTIGTGAVIGACSVVTHDVPPYAIVVGNPARILRYRFDEDAREKLLESEWWNLPENDIRRLQYDSPKITSDPLNTTWKSINAN